ncbi:MAG: Na(+)-translocating NADH-quinone reductase subunit A [Bacteroidales bacterium]|jgi:Na+-transporting NADH:ubiquinone oxidoreductase subunit A|nr:Na(+)-translocating NADH-quinone reductase subunit A [Bacteroidales bacterium]MDD3700618.1 Na(+)-translocating NADH-quinone reductase subunit A [Bacteroidales bacterium]MDY0368259.1 Na(+)-translocating NADH-quinone reductase subunit A [Bacteroidales bacterium]
MSNVIKIKKGLNINLIGEAEKNLKELSTDQYAIKPIDFIGVFPKMLVKEGEAVQAGTPIFVDKYRENIIFCSPVSGVIKEIKRGPKRMLLEVKITADGKDEAIDFGAENPKKLTREAVIDKLLKSGIWPFIRQRPYSVIANPDDTPKAIFISAFDTAPLAPDIDFVVNGNNKDFQTGIDALSILTKGNIHLNLDAGVAHSSVFTNAKGVVINQFSGPHPTGNVGVQISRIDPINKGDIVWYLYPQDVLTIGRLFSKGIVDASRIIALTGSEVLQPAYYKTKIGVNIEALIYNNTTDVNKRLISGNVLTGDKLELDGYVGFYHTQVTVIPEGDYYEFLGWGLPGFKKFSVSRTFPAFMFKNRKYRLDTNYHGGLRAYVMTGEFEKVFPFDIYPLQLIKAILIEDIDLMENLGIYEVDEEDFALCEVVDTSKTEIQSIVRKGLDLMRKEMS